MKNHQHNASPSGVFGAFLQYKVSSSETEQICQILRHKHKDVTATN
jgi:hypothetical protein